MLNAAHPEDIKAAIRKRYGTIRHFCQVNGLPTTGVSDLFRGRKSQRVSDAISKALDQSNELDFSTQRGRSAKSKRAA